MNRTLRTQRRAFGILLLLASCSSPEALVDLAPERPNIVLIISDDHGYPDFGFMGSQYARTPHLDRLAAEGTVFPLAYATASICQPSLRTLLITLFFSSIGMLGNPMWALQHWLPITLLVIGILIGKALIVWIVMTILGQTHRHALAAGLCLPAPWRLLATNRPRSRSARLSQCEWCSARRPCLTRLWNSRRCGQRPL